VGVGGGGVGGGGGWRVVGVFVPVTVKCRVFFYFVLSQRYFCHRRPITDALISKTV
jgi:hypothetical protein